MYKHTVHVAVNFFLFSDKLKIEYNFWMMKKMWQEQNNQSNFFVSSQFTVKWMQDEEYLKGTCIMPDPAKANTTTFITLLFSILGFNSIRSSIPTQTSQHVSQRWFTGSWLWQRVLWSPIFQRGANGFQLACQQTTSFNGLYALCWWKQRVSDQLWLFF